MGLRGLMARSRRGSGGTKECRLSKRDPGRWPSNGSREEPRRSSRRSVGTPDGTNRGRRQEEGPKASPVITAAKRHREGPGPQARAVVSRPWGDARGGQKRPESGEARRRRARHRRSRLRPGQDWKGAQPARDQESWSGPRSGRAGRPGPGHRKGHCRADAGGAGPAWQWQRRPLPRSSHPGSGPACRGRRANRRNWLGPTGESPAPSMRAPPRSHSSGGTASGESKRGGIASGDGEKTGSWLRYAGRGRMDRSQGTTRAAKPISTPLWMIVRAPRKSQSSSAPFW